MMSRLLTGFTSSKLFKCHLQASCRLLFFSPVATIYSTSIVIRNFPNLFIRHKFSPQHGFRRLMASESDASGEIPVKELVHGHRVVLLMKGTPDEPRCGFSNAVCRILEMHGILEKARIEGEGGKLFASYDVLECDDLRTAAKEFADWPTFPQLYFDGEFVGGCDILLEMHRSGKLTEELSRIGIGSALTKDSHQSS